MDVAYDHIQEEALPRKEEEKIVKDSDGNSAESEKQSLNAEFQEAYKSISTTAWGAKLGGFLSTVQKQGSTFYDEARQEASAASGEALKGFQDLRANLVSRARSMSAGEKPPPGSEDKDKSEASAESSDAQKEQQALAESEGVVSRFKAEAAKRLKELEKAEEAADAAILRFGSNIGNFLKEAVTIAPPGEDDRPGKSKILFESKTEDGKRVIHSTRLEAQLHAIHTSEDKFLQDPDSPQWADWKTSFDVEAKTQEIAKDLERFEELRKMMERCVPEKTEYAEFWCRYYFLRDLVEKSEQMRREVLQGATAQNPEEPISWDDDDDETSDNNSSTPQNDAAATTPSALATKAAPGSASPASLATIQPGDKNASLKPDEGGSRKSQDEKSQPDSDASYDLVSGATSKTPGSPSKAKGDEEEEEDWE